MSKKTFKPIAYVSLVAMGMFGLHLNIEYSGWVVFVGLLGVCVL